MQLIANKKETTILDPSNNMELKSIPSEIRFDPLTGRSARICHFMKLKWEKPDFEKLIKGTESRCPFCPDKVLKITPSFPKDIIPEGRLFSDDMILFPNLAPYDSLSAVATLGARHFIPMKDIKADLIAKGFNLAMDFFQKIDKLNHPESVYHLINWNYMPAAGSSLIHPHLQVFVTSSAPNLMRQELEAAKTYMTEHKSNYWDDLIDMEIEKNKRFLGKIGRTAWLTSYAPMGVAGDVLGIVENVRSTLDLTKDDIFDIAEGLTHIMAAYDEMGIYNFNMNFFTGSKSDEFARFHILFSPRTFFNQALGATDVGAIRNLYNETLCMAFPEEINQMIKGFFD
jgi:UDPglucose--hexose-1-phosphate uridylyltransferase